jgi:5-hydroxyisourate hydrolase-like protein (transthyretin family)
MPFFNHKLKYLTFIFLFSIMQTWVLPAQANNARVTGNIIDSTTGRPLTAATIEIRQRNNELVSELTSNANGRYESTDLPEGLFTIKVLLNGYRDAEEAGLRLIAGKSVTLNFSLQQLPADIEQVFVVARANTLSGTAPVSATQLNREEIRRAPGTAGDVFRGLNSLPGVTATGEFSDFSVRGRGPRDNLILIDGIPYDRLVHFDESLGEEDDLEGGGRFSIFGQNVIGNAEFQPGGWEAAYGGANGSLLKLNISEGNPETPFASIKVDLAGGELLYDGPSYLFENTSMLVSLRHYNFGWLFDLIGEKDIGTPELSDVIIKSVSRLNEHTTLKLLALYTPEQYTRTAKNVLASTDFNDTIVQKSRQQAGLLGITLENLLGDTARLRNTVYFRAANDENSLGEAFPEFSPEPVTAQNLFIEDPIIRLDETEREAGWRIDYNQVNQFGEFSVGTRLSYLSVDNLRAVSRDYPLFVYDQNDFRTDTAQAYVLLRPDTYNTRLDESAVRAAVYADQSFQVSSIILRPGMRVDHDGLLDTTMISPRFQASWQATTQTRLSLSTGLYYQAPRLLEIAANPANTTLDPERSTQLNLGIEHYFGNDYRMLLETYYQQ